MSRSPEACLWATRGPKVLSTAVLVRCTVVVVGGVLGALECEPGLPRRVVVAGMV